MLGNVSIPDQELFARLQAALNAINAASTPQQIRLEAQRVCDEFSQSENAIRIAMQFYALSLKNAGNSHDSDPIRYFCLNTTARAIRKRWDTLPGDLKSELKRTCLDLIDSGTKDACTEARFIKEKAVEIVVEIAKREWPQQWPEFLPRLKEISSKSETQAELFLKIIGSISEDASNSDFNAAIPGRRRLELMEGLLSGVSEFFLPMFYAFLERCFTVLPKTNMKLGFILATETLRTINACLEWIPITAIYDSNLIAALKEFCKSPYGGSEDGIRLQSMAWKSLRILASRKGDGNKGDGKNVTEWFGELLTPCFDENLGLPPKIGLFDSLPGSEYQKVWPAMGHPNVDSDNLNRLLQLYEVHKEVARMVNTLGMIHFANLWREPCSQNNSRVIEGYIEIVVRLLCHPSIALRSLVLSAVLQISKISLLRKAQHSTTKPKVPIVESNLFLILRCLGDHVMQVGKQSSPENQYWPTAAFSIEEFDEDDDFNEAWRVTKSTTIMLIKAIANNRYLVAMEFLRMRVRCACMPHQGPSNNFAMQIDSSKFRPNDSGSRDAIRTPAEAFYITTCSFLAEAIINCLPDAVFEAFGQGQTDPASVPVAAAIELKRTLEVLMQSCPNTANLLGGYVHCLGKFSKCYAAPPLGPSQYMGPVLQRLFECVTYRKEDEKNVACDDLSPETKTARRRACVALIDVCSVRSSPDMRAHFASLLPTFCEKVLHTIRNVGISAVEELFLYEMLVVVSNNLGDANAQLSFLNDILDQPLKNWMEQTTQYASSAEGLLHSIYNDPSFQPKLHGLQFLLHLIFSVAKRSKGIGNNPRPFYHYWGRLFPSMFNLLNILNQLWYPELLGKRPLRQSVQQAYKEEVRAILGASPSQDKYQHLFADMNEENKSSEFQILAKNTYSIAALRDTLYATIAESARYKQHGLFATDDTMQGLSQSILSRPECMENRHIAKFITVVLSPMVINCPQNCRRRTLFPFTVSLLSHTLKRLQTCWNYIKNPNQPKPVAVKLWGPIIPPPAEGSVCNNRDCSKCVWCQQSEVAWDASVRLLASGMVEILGTILNTWPTAPETDTRVLKPQELCEETLATDEMAAATLFSLIDCVLSPDSNCSHKAMLVFRRIFFACLVYKPRYHNFLATHLYKACLQCLFNPQAKFQAATSLLFIQTIKDIFVFVLDLDSKNKESRNFQPHLLAKLEEPLLSIPGVEKARIDKFVGSFSRSTSSKTRRQSTKTFLQECAECFGSKNEFFDKGETFQVRNLPQNENVDMQTQQHVKMKTPFQAQGSAWDLGINALFG